MNTVADEMTARDALNTDMDEKLARDDEVFLEDVAEYNST